MSLDIRTAGQIERIKFLVVGSDVHHAVGHRRRRIDRTPRRVPPQKRPVLAFKAYRFPSSDPTYTTPLATAGEEKM